MPYKVLELITGKKGNAKSYNAEIIYSEATNQNDKVPLGEFKNENTNEIKRELSALAKNPNNIITTSFKSNGTIKKYGLHAAHAYAVTKIDLSKGIVTLKNPHNASGKSDGKIIEIPLSFFTEYVKQLHWITV